MMSSSRTNQESNEIKTSSEVDIFVKGENQADVEYRDKYFAVAFWLQFIGVFTTALFLGPSVFKTEAEAENDSNNSVHLGSVVVLVGIATIGIVVATVLSLKVMIHYADKGLVKVAFFLAPISYGLGALIVFVFGGSDVSYIFFGAAALIALLSFCFYTCYKKYIPYAESTLRTALTALELNRGLFFLAFGALLAIYTWVLIWTFATLGIIDNAASKQVPCSNYYNDDSVNGKMCGGSPSGFVMILMVLCFYWSQQVVSNVLHTTTAGTVGCFWFNSNVGNNPETTSRYCSTDIYGSLSRAMTYSFGSICFGSLIVAIVETMESIARQARRHRNGAMLACVLQCLLHCIRVYIEYFNSWAYVYVGIYGYDYLTAGRNVINLLKSRGWSAIIADRLIFRVVFFIHIAVGGMGGATAVLADVMIGPVFSAAGGADEGKLASHTFSFMIGLFMGLVISSTALFVVESAVRTIIVCFAESPSEFEENHPQLYEAMMNGWTQTYPELFAEGTTLLDSKDSRNVPEARVIV